jgi:hypothetical protein
MRTALLVLVALAQLPYARQALDLGRTRDQALFDAFNRGYDLTVSSALFRAEVITEFRRAVLMVRERATHGDLGMTDRDLTKAMQPFEGLVTFVAEVRLHPLHTFATPPPYEMYIATGRATRPLVDEKLKRDAVYPPGSGFGGPFNGVRIEATFARRDIERAAEPILTIIDTKADILWQARIDISRYR